MHKNVLRVMRNNLAPAAALLLMAAGTACLNAAQADESSTTVIMTGPAGGGSSSSSMVVEDTKGVQFKFRERLNNIQTQIDRGLSNNWLAVGQAAAFKAERERLADVTNGVEKDGWPKDRVDQLEKDVTALSAHVSSATTKGGPKAAAPRTEESGAPLQR
jgi:hypothetical protein